jgi:hypothetical protein
MPFGRRTRLEVAQHPIAVITDRTARQENLMRNIEVESRGRLALDDSQCPLLGFRLCTGHQR